MSYFNISKCCAFTAFIINFRYSVLLVPEDAASALLRDPCLDFILPIFSMYVANTTILKMRPMTRLHYFTCKIPQRPLVSSPPSLRSGLNSKRKAPSTMQGRSCHSLCSQRLLSLLGATAHVFSAGPFKAPHGLALLSSLPALCSAHIFPAALIFLLFVLFVERLRPTLPKGLYKGRRIRMLLSSPKYLSARHPCPPLSLPFSSLFVEFLGPFILLILSIFQ